MKLLRVYPKVKEILEVNKNLTEISLHKKLGSAIEEYKQEKKNKKIYEEKESEEIYLEKKIMNLMNLKVLILILIMEVSNLIIQIRIII